MSESTPTLSDVIAAAIESRLESVFTAEVARVVRFDRESCTCAVQPLVRGSYVDESGERVAVTLPVIHGVPVAYPGAGPRRITYPLSPGDTVLVLFASSPVDAWKTSNTDKPVDATTESRHGLENAIAAIPALARGGMTSTPVIEDALVVHGDDVRLGDHTASSPVAIRSDLQSFMTALDSAITALGANPAAAALTALKTALQAASFPICAQKVRAR